MRDHKKIVDQVGITLARHFDYLYYIEIETGKYSVVFKTRNYPKMMLPDEGEDYYTDASVSARKSVHPGDLDMVWQMHDKATTLKNLSETGYYSAIYRLVIDGQIIHMRQIQLMCEDGKHMVCGLENIEGDYSEHLEKEMNFRSVERMARNDRLTGIRNKNAYIEYTEELDRKLKSTGEKEPFAIVMCDINDLKLINDTRGHSFGDEMIQRTSRMVCSIFKHSPVFRIGGDEFVAILCNKDYEQREHLLNLMREESEANGKSKSGPVVACGMAEYDPNADTDFSQVFERADQRMYENKTSIKSQKVLTGFRAMDVIDTPIPDERRRMLDSLFGALYTVAGGGYIYANDMHYDFSRWSLPLIDDFNLESEYMYHAGTIWQEYVHPEDIDVYKEAVDAVFCGDAEIRSIYYRVRKPDGSYVLMTTRGFVLVDFNGDPEYFGGIMIPQ